MLKKLTIIFLLVNFSLAAKAQNRWSGYGNVENNQICQDILALANSGSLKNQFLKSDLINWERGDGAKLLEIGLLQENQNVFFKRFDINGDGNIESVIINSINGSEDLFYLFDENINNPILILHYPQDNWQSYNLGAARSVAFLYYQGKFYKIGLTKINNLILQLHYLSQIDSKNVERVLCQFQPTGEYREELVKSSDNRICEIAKLDKLQYYDFALEHNISYKNIVEYAELSSQELRLQGALPRKYMSQIDIDNDGKKDDILLLDVGYSNNRLCKYTLPLKFDNKANVIYNSFANLLVSQIPDLCGGVEPNIFEYEGENYLQMKFIKNYPFNYHKIMKIRNNKMEKICDFDVRIIYRLIENVN